MSGYGAALIGFRHSELFGGVSILAGALHSPKSLHDQRRSIFDAVYRGDMAYAEAQSPWSVLRENAARLEGRTQVRIHVGGEDGLLERNRRYHALLEELEIAHTWSVVPDAPHVLSLVLSNWLGDPMTFYQTVFGAAETCALDVRIETDDAQVGWIEFPAGARCAAERHEFAEIRFIANGTAAWSLGGQTFTTPAGTAVLVPENSAHDPRSLEGDVTWVVFRWAPGGDERTLHVPSTMTDPVPGPDVEQPDIALKRYVSGVAPDRLHVHIDAIPWTTNWTYSEDLRRVYRYKPLVRAPLADWAGVSRTDVRMGFQELEPNAAYPGHHHPSAKIYVVLSGRARWTVGEQSFEATAGRVIHTPPDAYHRIENIGAERLRWLYFWWATGGGARQAP